MILVLEKILKFYRKKKKDLFLFNFINLFIRWWDLRCLISLVRVRFDFLIKWIGERGLIRGFFIRYLKYLRGEIVR